MLIFESHGRTFPFPRVRFETFKTYQASLTYVTTYNIETQGTGTAMLNLLVGSIRASAGLRAERAMDTVIHPPVRSMKNILLQF
jgi:hypothetical protein